MTNLFARTTRDLQERVSASGSMPGAIVSERRHRRILVVTATGALVGLLLAVLPEAPLGGPASLSGAATVRGAALLACVLAAVMLQLRVNVLDDHHCQWLADALVLTVPVLLLTIQAGTTDASIAAAAGIANEVRPVGATEFVTLELLWHLALVAAVLGQLFLGGRSRWRNLFVVGYTALIVTVMALPMDIVWFDAGGFSGLYLVCTTGLLVAHMLATLLWIRVGGSRPVMSHAAITVALVLGTAELTARLAIEGFGRPVSLWLPLLQLAVFIAPAITEGVSFAHLGQRAARAEELLADMATSSVATEQATAAEDVDLERVRSATLDLVDGQRYVIALQPIVDLQTGMPVGYEALTRFRGHPDPTPDVVLERAHGLGRGVELELDLIRAAIARLPDVPETAHLSLNVGPATLTDPRLPRALTGDLDRIVLEVTEHVEVDDYDVVNAILAPLRARGLRLAIDDTGAGFASLRHVVRLAPDVLKLDRSLVARADREPAQRAVLAAMIDLARGAGMTVVAEGVERPEEMTCLQTLGVDQAQGYLFGRPTIAPDATSDVTLLQTALVTAHPDGVVARR